MLGRGSTGSGWVLSDLGLGGPVEVKRDVRCCRVLWGFGVVIWVWGTHKGEVWGGGLWRNGGDQGVPAVGSGSIWGRRGDVGCSGVGVPHGMFPPAVLFPLVQCRGKGACRLGVPTRTLRSRQRCLPHWHVALISRRCLVLPGLCWSCSAAGRLGWGLALSPLSKTPSAPPKTVPKGVEHWEPPPPVDTCPGADPCHTQPSGTKTLPATFCAVPPTQLWGICLPTSPFTQECFALMLQPEQRAALLSVPGGSCNFFPS